MLKWTCTACGAANELPEAEYDDCEIYCAACGKRHYVSTRPTAWEIAGLEDADARDEEDEWYCALGIQYPCVRISHDGGETWHDERVNAVEFDPARNLTVRPGDLVRFRGLYHEVIVRDGWLATRVLGDRD